MRNFLILLLLITTCSHLYSQSPDRYMEIAGDNKIRFFFDEQYYLVDKQCKFLSIVRVAAFNKERNGYEGEFTDYDINGKIVLTGAYSNGKKNGIFKSFYPNGFLKWQGEFKQNLRSGTWNFYYPDGKSQNILEIKDNRIYIMHSWDDQGKQVVKNGEGKFSLDSYPLGFNEAGYNGFRYSGKVKNGLRNKIWSIKYIFPKGKTATYSFETYAEGNLITPFSADLLLNTQVDQPLMGTLIPIEYYSNSEKLTSKKCTVDDISGFTDYLETKLNLLFTLIHLTDEHELQPLKISLHVNEHGQSSGIKIDQYPQIEGFSTLQSILNSIRYWIPSQTNGKVIADTLKIQSEIYRDEFGKPAFSLPLITRTDEE